MAVHIPTWRAEDGYYPASSERLTAQLKTGATLRAECLRKTLWRWEVEYNHDLQTGFAKSKREAMCLAEITYLRTVLRDTEHENLRLLSRPAKNTPDQ